jgi:hypothetical protein
MAKMKKQREKETALVKRAMGELKNLREQIAAKDKAVRNDPSHFVNRAGKHIVRRYRLITITLTYR